MTTTQTACLLGKKSVAELRALGYNLKAYSSGGDLLVQSFIAIYKRQRFHGWYSEKLKGYMLARCS